MSLYFVSKATRNHLLYCENDTSPDILFKLRNKNFIGSTVSGILSRPDGTQVTRQLSLVNEKNNLFLLEWQTGDLVLGYNQSLKIVETELDGTIETHFITSVDVAGVL